MWLTPYQSEDPSLTIPTHKKWKNSWRQKGCEQHRPIKSIGPSLKTRQPHTIEYWEKYIPVSLWNIPVSLWNIPVSLWNIPVSLWSFPVSLWNIPVFLKNIPVSLYNIPVSLWNTFLGDTEKKIQVLRYFVVFAARWGIRTRKWDQCTACNPHRQIQHMLSTIKRVHRATPVFIGLSVYMKWNQYQRRCTEQRYGE